MWSFWQVQLSHWQWLTDCYKHFKTQKNTKPLGVPKHVVYMKLFVKIELILLIYHMNLLLGPLHIARIVTNALCNLLATPVLSLVQLPHSNLVYISASLQSVTTLA